MPFIDPLTGAALVIMASSRQTPQQYCAEHPTTEISVKPTSQEINWDYNKTTAELQGIQMDTVNPYSFSGVTMTEGYMKASVKMVPRVKLAYKTVPRYEAVCLWYEKITIEMEIDPTIVIPKEVYDDECMGEAVANHEMKHIKVDRKIVNKYSQVMGQKVYDALAQRGFSAGPIPKEGIKQTAEAMQRVVYQIVEQEYKRMDLERMDLQREVDSLEEYNRVSAECPDYRPPEDAIPGRKNKRRDD